MIKTADRDTLEKIERKSLSPLAALSSRTKGRDFPEKRHPYRTEFQRDRERIIHSRAFRRLEYKTQVFINHEGDHYRTRLTHTIEVAQIARTIARALRLNEDLAESIALAHDLGHTPFGHAGERELDSILRDHGGFEHNRQSLRVVEVLDTRLDSFTGLNLCWESREGIIKHSGGRHHPEVLKFSPLEQPSLEAQIIDIADEIAYINHDLDDGLLSGILVMTEVENLELWKMCSLKNPESSASFNGHRHRIIIKEIINLCVSDLIENVIKKINENKIKDYSGVKKHPGPLVSFSANLLGHELELKKFLVTGLYRHRRVEKMSLKAAEIIRELFEAYKNRPELLPDDFRKKIDEQGIYRTITDYIAGMTDRYALEEHKKITGLSADFN